MQTGAVAHSMHTSRMHAQMLSQARGPKYINRVTVGVEVNFCNILVNYSHFFFGGGGGDSIKPLLN